MKKYWIHLLFIPLFLTASGVMAQTATVPTELSSQWTLIKHIEETSMYIPADKAFERTPAQPDWRTFRMLLNDTDIAPNSLIITVTLDCATESMRTDRFDVYDEVNGKGKIIRSTAAESSEFVPMNDDLAASSKAYEAFCTQH